MSEWQDVKTAPRGGTNRGGGLEDGPVIDLFGKRWNHETDKFEYRRFTDMYYGYGLDGHGSWMRAGHSASSDRIYADKWRITHWMPVPTLPVTEREI